MTIGEFKELVERYRLGLCSPEEESFVEEWMSVHGEVNEYDPSVFDGDGDAERLEKEIWREIALGAGIRRNSWKFSLNSRWLISGLAACLTLVILGRVYLDRSRMGGPELNLEGLATINTSSVSQRIVLPDSSIVVLAKGASLSTAEDYGKEKRVVQLKGEAFFEVKSNPRMPFLVYCGDLVTEVLGTSFTIRPETQGKKIEVLVASGKVSVYSNGEKNQQRRSGVIVTRNQKAVFDTESKNIRQDLVDEPMVDEVLVEESAFKFDEATVEEVLGILRNSYGMEIVVTNPELNACQFTGDLSGFELFKQLDYVCNATGSRYEIRGTTIFLLGEGCNGKD